MWRSCQCWLNFADLHWLHLAVVVALQWVLHHLFPGGDLHSTEFTLLAKGIVVIKIYHLFIEVIPQKCHFLYVQCVRQQTVGC